MLLKHVSRASNILFLILSIFSLFIPKNRRLILFGAFDGKHYGDNCGALYQYFTKFQKEDFRSVWLTDSKDVLLYVQNMGGETYLKISLTGIWLSIRAHLIVTTHHTSDVILYNPILKRPKELLLLHGAPMNRGPNMGHLTSSKRIFKIDRRTLKHSNNITYMIATSLWGANQSRTVWPVPSSKIKITGYPRNDMFFQPDMITIDSIKKKYSLDKYIVLYATTYRKWAPVRYFPFEDLDIDNLYQFLKDRSITIIIRPHSADLKRQKDNLLWNRLKELSDVIRIITRDEIPDTQPLLLLSDCLITDYSSIQQDYLLLNRPIIFLPYDINEFPKKVGGFNFDYEEFSPGPKPKTQAEFLGYLEMFVNKKDPFVDKRLKIKDLIHDYKDGQSCRRVYELIKEMTTPV